MPGARVPHSRTAHGTLQTCRTPADLLIDADILVDAVSVDERARPRITIARSASRTPGTSPWPGRLSPLQATI